jgi:hypothetical protein
VNARTGQVMTPCGMLHLQVQFPRPLAFHEPQASDGSIHMHVGGVGWGSFLLSPTGRLKKLVIVSLLEWILPCWMSYIDATTDCFIFDVFSELEKVWSLRDDFLIIHFNYILVVIVRLLCINQFT